MDLKVVKEKVSATSRKVADHLNISATVETLPDGRTVITLPATITAEHVYESKSIDPKTKEAKKTPISYVLPQSTKAGQKQVTCTMAVEGTDMKVTYRMGGFTLFVNAVE